MVTRVLRGSRMLPGVQKAQGDPNMVPSAKGSKNSFTERLKKISTFEAFLFCLFDFFYCIKPGFVGRGIRQRPGSVRTFISTWIPYLTLKLLRGSLDFR